MNPISCHIVRRWSAKHVAGRLDPGRAQAMREHLATCESCNSELREVQAAADLLQSAIYESAVPARDLAAGRRRDLARFSFENVVPFPKSLRPRRIPAHLLSRSTAIAAALVIVSLAALQPGMLSPQRTENRIDRATVVQPLSESTPLSIRRALARPAPATNEIRLAGISSIDHLYPPAYGIVRQIEDNQALQVAQRHPYFGIGGPHPDLPWNYGFILF